jgi:hypothetical protein
MGSHQENVKMGKDPSAKIKLVFLVATKTGADSLS